MQGRKILEVLALKRTILINLEIPVLQVHKVQKSWKFNNSGRFGMFTLPEHKQSRKHTCDLF